LRHFPLTSSLRPLSNTSDISKTASPSSRRNADPKQSLTQNPARPRRACRRRPSATLTTPAATATPPLPRAPPRPTST
jgi:hypothetical protein